MKIRYLVARIYIGQGHTKNNEIRLMINNNLLKNNKMS